MEEEIKEVFFSSMASVKSQQIFEHSFESVEKAETGKKMKKAWMVTFKVSLISSLIFHSISESNAFGITKRGDKKVFCLLAAFTLRDKRFEPEMKLTSMSDSFLGRKETLDEKETSKKSLNEINSFWLENESHERHFQGDEKLRKL
jgi:hypothetical protein